MMRTTRSRAGLAEERGSFVDGLGIVVVSSSDPSPGYRWQVRRLDGVVLEQSIETFRTMLLARYAGLQALRGGEPRTKALVA